MANRGTSKFHYSASCIQNSFAWCTQGYLYGVSRRCVIQVNLPLANTCTEFSSGMYSPEVFTIAQLLGELPYCILCAIVYWIIMVIGSNTFTLPLSIQNCRSSRKGSAKAQLGWAEPGCNWWSSFLWNFSACHWDNSSQQLRPLSKWVSCSTRLSWSL